MDLSRAADFAGGDVVKSIAEAERAGGEGGMGLIDLGGALDRPGEAVCARDGGGGGTAGFSGWRPAYRTSVSYI